MALPLKAIFLYLFKHLIIEQNYSAVPTWHTILLDFCLTVFIFKVNDRFFILKKL